MDKKKKRIKLQKELRDAKRRQDWDEVERLLACLDSLDGDRDEVYSPRIFVEGETPVLITK